MTEASHLLDTLHPAASERKSALPQEVLIRGGVFVHGHNDEWRTQHLRLTAVYLRTLPQPWAWHHKALLLFHKSVQFTYWTHWIMCLHCHLKNAQAIHHQTA